MTLRAQGARVAMPTPTPDVPPLNPAMVARPPTNAAAPAAPRAPAADARCPRCGETNPAESRFCHSCGLSLSPPANAANPANAADAKAAPPDPRAVAPSVVARPGAGVVAPTIVCGRCRGVAEPGADFCKFCGARLSQPQLDVATPAADVEVSISTSNAPPPRPISNAPPARDVAIEVSPARPLAPARSDRPMGATRPHHGIGEALVRGRIVRIAKDGSEGAQHPIVNDTTDIGRAEGNIVLPEDPYLSPRHARIVVRSTANGTALVLADLASVNGTFVRVRRAHNLAHGDLLLLGQQVLRFEAVSELEGARGPAMQHGVLLFGSPAPVARGRLVQRTVEGLGRDMFYLVKDEFVIGRESGDRTFPDDVFMSRRHAAVRRDGASYLLHDLGSSNGTFVQIHGEHTLQDGDQFRVGHHLFRFDSNPSMGPPGSGPS